MNVTTEDVFENANFSVGDTVRVGKGKVEWTVIEVTEADIRVQSESGRKNLYPASQLTLIRPIELNEGDKHMRFVSSHMKDAPVAKDGGGNTNDHRESDYGQAILNGLQSKPVYTKSTPWTTVKKRLKAAKAAKQARKANR